MKPYNDTASQPETVERNGHGVFSSTALEAMQRAVREAVAEHHRVGNPVAIWQDGRVVFLYPDGSTRPVEETAPNP